MSEYTLAVIPGDGIGPEIVGEALKVLDRVGEKFGHTFTYQKLLMGGAAYDACGTCFPDNILPVCREADSVILGAVGGPKWDTLPGTERPEKALLKIRSGLGLYANLRPAIMHRALAEACPIKQEIIGDGFDIMVVRELTGGIYFGDRGYREGRYGTEAYDTESYSEFEIRRIAKLAYETAMARKKKLVSVDKANVLESSRLWRKIVTEMNAEYPEVEVSHMYVDNAAMQLVRNPGQFDVIVTSNMFGDILSDEASMITGSIGMLPSASLGEGAFGMYEPIHGSAPDIAGQDIANPIATILSVSMLLKYSLGLSEEAAAIERAVTEVLDAGYRTGDIAKKGETVIGTKEMGALICGRI